MPLKSNPFNAEYVRLILDYNPETGIFKWKNLSTATPQRNAQWAGKIAGYPHKGYQRININGAHHRAHRLAWLYMTGEWPKEEIDHRNNEKNDNRFLNLREVVRNENAKNRLKSCNNTSGVKGVSYRKESGLWRVRIMVDKKPIHLGDFKNIKEAGEVYKEAALKLHGEFARVA